MRRRLITLAAAVILPLGGVLAAAPAMAASCGSGGTTWEQTQYGEVGDGYGEQDSVTQANNWGGGSACLTVPGSTYSYDAAFADQASAGSYTGSVLSDPDSYIGCQGGYCTSGTPLSEEVGSGPSYPDLEYWWGYSLAYVDPDSAYDELINSNFSDEACTSNSDDPSVNTNIGIYLDAEYPGKAAGEASYVKLGLANAANDTTTATIDGVSWYVLDVDHSGTYKIEFTLENPSDAATGTDGTSATTPGYVGLGDFISWIEGQSWGSAALPGTDYQCEADTGDEIWADGAGLDSEWTLAYMTTAS